MPPGRPDGDARLRRMPATLLLLWPPRPGINGIGGVDNARRALLFQFPSTLSPHSGASRAVCPQSFPAHSRFSPHQCHPDHTACRTKRGHSPVAVSVCSRRSLGTRNSRAARRNPPAGSAAPAWSCTCGSSKCALSSSFLPRGGYVRARDRTSLWAKYPATEYLIRRQQRASPPCPLGASGLRRHVIENILFLAEDRQRDRR